MKNTNYKNYCKLFEAEKIKSIGLYNIHIIKYYRLINIASKLTAYLVK